MNWFNLCFIHSDCNMLKMSFIPLRLKAYTSYGVSSHIRPGRDNTQHPEVCRRERNDGRPAFQ